jgi:predicted acylesterase/phospholipase RssA
LPRVALSLSGGGFRATLFHLGVVRFLHEAGLLRLTSSICAVSGGSILAADLARQWSEYTGSSDQFFAASRSVIDLCRNGIRERLLPRIALAPFVGGTTGLLSREYRKVFGKDDVSTLNQSAGSPLVYLLCSNLTAPEQLVAFHSRGLRIFSKRPDDCREIQTQEATVCDAVATSSAFPLLFPPLSISAKRLRVENRELWGTSQLLSDGGVFDNLGNYAIRQLDREASHDLVIVSDASAGVDWQNRGSLLHRRIHRVGSILCQQVRDYELAEIEKCKKSCLVSIDSFDNSSEVRLDDDVQRYVPKIRTDLDRFTRDEIVAIVQHGYVAARQSVKKFLDSDPTRFREVVGRLHFPDQTTALWNPLSDDRRSTQGLPRKTRLRKGSKRRLALFSFRDRAVVGWGIIACGLSAAYLWLA